MNTNNESPAALLPCPFCGSADIQHWDAVHFETYCHDCGAAVRQQYKTDEGIALSIASWNRRATTDPVASESRGSVPDGWRPIETAPRNSERVIVACKSEHTHEWHVVEAWWAMPYEDAPAERCEWRYDGTHCMLDKSIHGIGASHWQPKPLHPEAAPTPPAVSNGEPTAEHWKIAVKECPKDIHIAGNPKGWIVGRAHELARSAAAKGEGQEKPR